ncbi:MAG TPA: GAF domain-containing SpoIIE family protein phosphatase, partial [Herpetosiphonaceae bacterium]
RRSLALAWSAGLFGGGLALAIGAGWPVAWQPFLLIGLFLALLDGFAVRDNGGQPLSLAGVVLLTAALHYGPSMAVPLALVSGLLIKPPRVWSGWVEFVGRRLAESGGRAIGLWLMLALVAALPPALTFIGLIIGYVSLLQLARTVFALLWIGRAATLNRLRALTPDVLLIEVVPLPLAILGEAILNAFAWPLIALAMAGLLGSAILLRRGSRSLGQQRRVVAELGQINAISRAIIRAELDVDALCDLIYTEATKVVDTRNFRLGLFDGKQFELKVRVLEGEREPPLTVTLHEDQGIVGWMRRTGRSLLVEDFLVEMDQLPARPSYQAEQPPRSGIYIPLLAGDDVLGTLSIQSLEPHAFDTEDLRLLSLIADQAAIAIAKARAYDAARRRAAQLATISEVSRQATAILELDRLLPSVVRRIRASFGYYQVHIFTVDPLTQELIFRASTNPHSPFWQRQGERLAPGVGIVGHVASTGEPMLINDVRDELRFIPDQADTQAELAVPLRVGSQIIGVLDVQSDRYDAFDENDFFVLQTLADQIAIAIESANLFTAQQEEAWVLNALLQSAENVARTTELDHLLELLVRLPAMLVGSERAICLLWDREDFAWTVEAAWDATGAGQALSWRKLPVQGGDTAPLDQLRTGGEARVLGEDARRDLLALARSVPGDDGALLALPLTARAVTLGVLLLDRIGPHAAWLPRQITIAAGIAGQAAAAIESAIYALEKAAHERLEQEITVAREIQTSLLPEREPQIAGWEIAASWESARQIGGDFYDFWQLPGTGERELGFVIADVSDKGVPAALFMALARSLVRAAALDGTSPAVAMERANRWIVRDSQSCMFVTLFYAVLDPASGTLRYTCAGHNPPLLYRAASGAIEPLRTPGIALGVLDEITLIEAETALEPGDVLLCYTDGVTEAVNNAMEEWGVPRLSATITANAGRPAQTLVDAVLAGVQGHAEGRPPFDDVTLVVIKRT